MRNNEVVMTDQIREILINQWISVEEELPEPRIDVLICTAYGKMAAAYFHGNKNNRSWGWTDAIRCEHSYGSVTHWMPLPESPLREETQIKNKIAQ